MRDRPVAQAIDAWPQFLPGGRRFLFLRQTSAGTDAGAAAFVGTFDGQGVREILAGVFNVAFAAPDRLVFVDATAVTTQRVDPDRDWMTGDVDEIPIEVSRHLGRAALTVSMNGTLAYASAGSRESRVVWVDRGGRETGVFASGAGWRDIALSPDRTNLAAQRITANANDIWIVDLARGVPSRFTFSPDVDDDPLWSPDGRTFAFSSIRDGAPASIRSRSTALPAAIACCSPTASRCDRAHGRRTAASCSTNRPIPRPRRTCGSCRSPAIARCARISTPLLRGRSAVSPNGAWVAYSSDES